MAVAAANTNPTASSAPHPFTYTQRPVSAIWAVSSRRGLAFGVPGGNATAMAVVHIWVNTIVPSRSHNGWFATNW